MHLIDDSEDLPAPESWVEGRFVADVAEPANSNVAPEAADLVVALPLDDLLPDTNGEIVIVGGTGDSHLSIITDQRICEAGVVESHVTADGYDVGGHAYYAFEGGTRLYYSPDLNLVIAQAE